MRALLWRKRTRLLSSFSFLRWVRNLWEWWRPSSHTVQWSHRETHSLIKIRAHSGVAQNWPFSDLSSHGGLRLPEPESKTHKMSWNNSGVTPEGVTLTSSTCDHYTHSLVICIAAKFSLKWETESLKNRNKGVSESLPLTNTPARFMYNTYGAHTCKYLDSWRNYTKRDLNLKWPNSGSCDISKLIILHTQLEKAGSAYFDCYLETCKRGNDRITSSWETNMKLLGTKSKLKMAASTDCQVAGLVELGSHVWHLCHLAFDIWAPFYLLFHLECDSCLVKFWFSLVLLVRFCEQTSGINCSS